MNVIDFLEIWKALEFVPIREKVLLSKAWIEVRAIHIQIRMTLNVASSTVGEEEVSFG